MGMTRENENVNTNMLLVRFVNCLKTEANNLCVEFIMLISI